MLSLIPQKIRAVKNLLTVLQPILEKIEWQSKGTQI